MAGQVDVEVYFDKIVEKSSSEWDKLAKKLGFNRSQIRGIEDLKRDNDRRCREVLETWRNRKGRAATLEVLQKALKDIGELQTAENLEGDELDQGASGSAARPQKKEKAGLLAQEESGSVKKGRKTPPDARRGLGSPFTVGRKGTASFAVLLVGDEYGTSKGGISTINRKLARLLIRAGIEVYCTVLEASDQDRADAEQDGVTLIIADAAGSTAKPCLEWLTLYHRVHFPHLPQNISCIVGHADVTSRAARKIKEERFPHAKLVMFGHVMPEETEHYKSDEKALGIGKKEVSIQEDIGKANTVFSVGLRIYSHYSRFLQKQGVAHYVFFPEPTELFCEEAVSYGEPDEEVGKPERAVLSVGRVRKVEKLKGHDLAAQAMDKVADRLQALYTLRWRIRGIDENDFSESKQILEEKLSSGRLKPTLLPYGTQEEIRRDMEASHLVLMPSRAEPFGLVGLEAIAAGVPVLISEESGLAEFIKEQSEELGQPKFRHCIVNMKGDTETDVERWAERIQDVITNAKSEFEEAAAFRDKLLASRYWEESHRNFLQACGITADASAQPEDEDSDDTD